jgi:hypothetical protein
MFDKPIKKLALTALECMARQSGGKSMADYEKRVKNSYSVTRRAP